MSLQVRSTSTDRFVPVSNGYPSLKFDISDDKKDTSTNQILRNHTKEAVIVIGSDRHTIRIRDLADSRLHLIEDLLVTLELCEGIYTAYNYDLDQFGYGQSEPEALDDFRTSVVDEYFFYKGENKANLGPVPLRHWSYLQRIIREI